MWLINFITSPVSCEICLKLIIAFFLSLIIGIEREIIHRPAGIKTHSLICISSTLVMSIGTYMHDIYGATIDPSRLPAQILAGIGFVGAGTIIREGFSVKGITTAASLLAVTCIGLAIGVGFYEGAIFSTLFIFLILSLTSPLQNLIDKKRKVILYTISVTDKKGAISTIQELFEENDVTVLNIKQIPSSKDSEYTVLSFLVKTSNPKIRESLITKICGLNFVKEVFVSKKSYHIDVE